MDNPRLLATTVHTQGLVGQGPPPDGRYTVVVAGAEIARPRRADARISIVLLVVCGACAGTTIAYACRAELERRAAHKPYPAFARFLEAATGIACGDEAQRYLDERALIGQRLEVVLRLGFDGAQRIVAFAAPSPGPSGLGRLARERIAALVRGADVDAAGLRDLVASVSRGRTRSYLRLHAAEADALAARLRGTRAPSSCQFEPTHY